MVSSLPHWLICAIFNQTSEFDNFGTNKNVQRFEKMAENWKKKKKMYFFFNEGVFCSKQDILTHCLSYM